MARADSVVVDPHKHGLQPYGCGCVVFADPRVGRFYAARLALHVLHLQRAASGRDLAWNARAPGPLPPRCGRRCARFRFPAKGWARHLAAARAAGLALAARFAADERVELLVEPELDIVCCLPADPAVDVDAAFAGLARDGWHVATLRVGDRTALRFCLMKPEHLGVVDALAEAVGARLAG